VAVAAIDKLAGAADDAFEAVRLLIEDETFRRLEPHVADNLRRFAARSAGRERTALAARIDERVTIVQSEIENQTARSECVPSTAATLCDARR